MPRENTTDTLPAASPRARRVVEGYSAGTAMQTRRKALEYQARRAQYIARRLAKPGVLVLNDPVGSGKTLVALTAAHLLLEAQGSAADRVTRVVVVAPDATVARIWAERARLTGWNPHGTYKKAGAAATPDVHVLTRAQLANKTGHWLAGPKSNVLLIVDEAHRGLQGNTNTYRTLVKWARGAHVLLVTATPFQLRPSGLERMLEIDGNDTAGDGIKAFTQAMAQWLTARHDHEFPPIGATTTELRARVQDRAAQVRQTFAGAKPDLTALLMPPYDRQTMRMPAQFALPEPLTVAVPEQWSTTYHVARLLPDLLQLSVDEHDLVARNSDAYMRMLTSSHRAWRDTKVYGDAWASGSLHIRALVDSIDAAFGKGELGHPKVAATAAKAVEAAESGRHVLIFCVFRQTQPALADAITTLLKKHGTAKGIRVEAPQTAAAARKFVGRSRPGDGFVREGFGEPAGASNRPIIMIVRDNLSESIDLDGGHPVVIHHDLAWSPVRWTQRLGRVVRASTGFQPLAAGDVIVPVLATAIDERMWHTMKGRQKLTTAVASDATTRALLEEWLPDWGQDD